MVLSGATGAYFLNKSVKRGVTEAESLISLVRFLRSEIECFSMPVPRALARCPREILHGCGYENECAPSEIGEIAECITDGASHAQLLRFCEELGKGYREEQLSLCDYYIAIFEERRRKLSEGLPARKKMNCALCLCSALAIVILLF